jgi:hypothetical protein
MNEAETIRERADLRRGIVRIKTPNGAKVGVCTLVEPRYRDTIGNELCKESFISYIIANVGDTGE